MFSLIENRDTGGTDTGSFLYIDEDELLNYDNEEIKNRIDRHVEKLRNTFIGVMETTLPLPVATVWRQRLASFNRVV